MQIRNPLTIAGAAGAVLAGALLLPSATDPAAAVTAKAGGVTATVDSTGVRLDWPSDADAPTYLVVDDRSQRVLWRGTATDVQLDAPAPTSVEWLVVAVNEQQPTAVAKVLATNPPTDSDLTPWVATTTGEGTTLSWGPIGGADSYTVTADGEQVASTSVPRAQVPARLGQTARYEVETQAPTAATGDQAFDTFTYGVDITPPATDMSTFSTSSSVGDVAAAGLVTMRRSVTNYETFIPQAHVDGPESPWVPDCEGGADWWYGGDDRWVGFRTGKYRTRGDVKFNWRYATMRSNKDVQSTHRYREKRNGDLAYDSSRTASDDGFVIHRLRNDGRYGRAVIEHEVGNPYCTFLADISYNNQQDLYQDGSHWIYGSHNKMPNHQFYRADHYSDGSRKVDRVFHHPLKDPYCLNVMWAPCGGNRQYQYTR